MIQLIAMLVASTGVALTTAGPGCSKCADEASSDAPAQTTSAAAVQAGAYKSAAWPAHNTDIYAKDLQGQQLPVALGNETWITDQVSTQGKVVVLEFWATWCPPCRAASPILDELQKENPENLAILAIAGQRDPEPGVRSYIEEHQVAYAHLYDGDQSVYKQFESQGIPLSVVLSSDGTIRWIGNPHEEGFLAAVNQTLSVDPAVQARVSAQANAKEATKIDG